MSLAEAEDWAPEAEMAAASDAALFVTATACVSAEPLIAFAPVHSIRKHNLLLPNIRNHFGRLLYQCSQWRPLQRFLAKAEKNSKLMIWNGCLCVKSSELANWNELTYLRCSKQLQ